MAWDEWVSGLVTAGTGAGEIYKAWTGDDSSDEAAYLRGANDVLASQLQQQRDDNSITIGDAKISTSAILWIIGGTLGLLAVGLGVKKLM